MTLRFASSFVLVLLAGVLLAGCGSRTQPENAAAFAEMIGKSGYEVELQPDSETHPGFVIGKATSKDGISRSFAFSFGPAPEKLPPVLANSDGAHWFEIGDGLAYWFEEFPQNVPPEQSDRVLDMQFAIEDAACQAIADRDCGG